MRRIISKARKKYRKPKSKKVSFPFFEAEKIKDFVNKKGKKELKLFFQLLKETRNISFTKRKKIINFAFSLEGIKKLYHRGSFQRTIDLFDSPFPEHKVKEFLLRKEAKKNIRKTHKVKGKYLDLQDPSALFVKGNKAYRNVNVEGIVKWQRLQSKLEQKYGKDIPIERILMVTEEMPEALKKQEKIDTELGKGEKYLVSKIEGQSLKEFFENNTSLPLATRLKVARKIVKTITEVWDLGYLHSHPHEGNWTIRMKNGEPEVKLIDVSQMLELKKPSLFSLMDEYTFILDSISHTMGFFDPTGKITKKFQYFLNSKISKYR